MTQPAPQHLRPRAQGLATALPPLLLAAERLAAGVSTGVHGRRRAGPGEQFWQYRQALQGDALGAVDWRRSARSDSVYIREREWEAAHTVALWADTSLSMAYASPLAGESKGDRARLLTLALALLLDRGGERTALPATLAATPRHGPRQMERITQVLASPPAAAPEYGIAPDFGPLDPAQTVLFSDFLGPEDAVFPALSALRNDGRGLLVQVLDPSEESFPFDGRIVFESMGGGLSFETRRASALQPAYRARLAERREKLREFARAAGWHFLSHDTGQSAQAALLAIYSAIGPTG